MPKKEITRWGHVSLRIEPDDDGCIVLMLDGCEYTFETHFDALLAFRLGQALVRTARKLGLPADVEDPSV